MVENTSCKVEMWRLALKEFMEVEKCKDENFGNVLDL